MAGKRTTTSAQSRRAKREAAQKEHAAQLAEQSANEAAAVKTAHEQPARRPAIDPEATKTEKKVAKQRAKKAQQKAVQEAVDKEGQRSANPEVVGETEIKLNPGEHPPLDVLNRLARQQDVDTIADAHKIGGEVGRFARDQVLGRADRGRHSRLKKVRASQGAMERVQKAQKTE